MMTAAGDTAKEPFLTGDTSEQGSRTAVSSAGRIGDDPRLPVAVDVLDRASAGGGQATAGLKATSRPVLTWLVLACCDMAAVSVAATVAVLVRYKLGGDFELITYGQLSPVLGLFIAAFALAGLYSFPLSLIDEFRKVVMLTAAIHLVFGAAVFIVREGHVYSRGIFVVSWVLCTVLVLSSRMLARMLLAHRPWWGCPVVVVGLGRRGRQVLRLMLTQPEMGLTPVGVVHDRRWGARNYQRVPVLGGTELLAELADHHPPVTLVVVTSDIGRETLDQLVKQELKFRDVILAMDLPGLRSLDVRVHDMGGVPGLHLQHRLLQPVHLAVKRVTDLFLLAVLSPVLAVMIPVIALMVKSTSRGSVFYSQERIGRWGRPFKIWKFRTMVLEPERVLKEHLDGSAEARREWRSTQKLRDDPRLTFAGRLLRRGSLDELPQMWNVLKGQMSLVGPRPIVTEEIGRYGDEYGAFCRVRPGMTGLWQVSGRNKLSYSDRVRLDAYYIRNWTTWLDAYIVWRTVFAVVTGRGAY